MVLFSDVCFMLFLVVGFIYPSCLCFFVCMKEKR